MNKQGKTIGGTQSVQRALGLLSLLARSHESGMDLPELVACTGLERVTAYRLLTSLVHTGFAARDERKRYRLGLESMQLGLAALTRAPAIDVYRSAMQAIARRTEDTVYLIVRVGDFGHTIHMETGAYPIKAFTSYIGGLKLLGVGAAGRALLGRMTIDEVGALHARHHEPYVQQGLTLAKLREMRRSVVRTGYSETDDALTPGVGGVGVAFPTPSSGWVAISVAAIKQRMNAARRKWIAEVVLEELAKIEDLSSIGVPSK